MEQHTLNIQCHGYNLHTRSWASEGGKGVVVLVHGMGEHAGRYATSVVPQLVGAGFQVFATDHFGHGLSEGPRGVCPGYEAVLDSIGKTLEVATDTYPDLPVFLYGHSMGGNAVLGFAMKRNPRITGVISTSPLLKMAFEPPAWKMVMGRLLEKVLPTVTLPSGLDANQMSRIPEEVKKYEDDPLNHDRVSGSYVFPFLEMGAWMLEHPEELKLPALLCHGTGDKVTSHLATSTLGKRVEKGQTLLIEGGYHELQNDCDSDKFFDSVIQWLDQTI